jgi:glycosyltransferase involved in cell wall biosynthesis
MGVRTATMKVSHYFEWEEYITGGHAQSVDNQRKIMDRREIEYTTEPTLDADLLHLNNMGPKSVYWARKARKSDVPVLVHTHQTAEDFQESFALSNVLARPMKPYLRYAYSLADHLVCPSEYNRAVIEAYSDAPKTVVSNGFDPDKVAGFDDATLREEYLERYDLDPPVVFTVGHVIKRKGLAEFVETARRLPDLDFVWFGYLNPAGGELDRFLKSRDTKRLVENAPDNCQFTGYVEDIRGAYAAGDVFFWPSKNENEGIALLEAMACGKPLLIRDIPTYDWLDDGTHCLKSSGEVGDFTAKLERLRDPERHEQLGANAKEKSRAFELDAVGDDLVALYRKLA